MSDQPMFSLLAATRHIGRGGLGKLPLILEKLPCAQGPEADIEANSSGSMLSSFRSNCGNAKLTAGILFVPAVAASDEALVVVTP
jgi:hypothetical protein